MRYWICLMLLLAVGCATGSKSNWNSRIGALTYDEAIGELGVPDRTATLTDGSVVVEWLKFHGTTYLNANSFPGAPMQAYEVHKFPDRYLRLTFGPDHKLAKAEEVTK
jgi:hypothetical protein